MSEYNLVVQAVDVIRLFLNTHESNSTTCFWESDIDGTILKTDWGYFEEGLDEIRDYCERLDSERKDEPQTDCDGCRHYADEHTADTCYECKRSYADCYEPQTDCPKSCPSKDICTKDETDCVWKRGRVMHYKTDRHINKIMISDELVMEMDVGNGWSVTDVWWDHDIPPAQVDCIKVKFEKVKGDNDENL